MTHDTDAIIIGAGAVGLACAYALVQRGFETIVLEKEKAIGQGVSSRNSEVIHGGLYYPSGSLKARLCVEGRRGAGDGDSAWQIVPTLGLDQELSNVVLLTN